MRRLIGLLTFVVVVLFLNIGIVSSQEDTVAPSEQTWTEIQKNSTSSSDAASPSLRAAPPDGPSIGETPIGDASISGFLLIGLIYFLSRVRKFERR